MNTGIIGCGNISDAYSNGAKLTKNINIIACADIDKQESPNKAEIYNIKSLDIDSLLSD